MSKIAQAPDKDAKKEEEEKDKAEALVKCKALEKIKNGDLHAITFENAQELFNALDVSERGELQTDDVRVLMTIPDLHMTEEDMDNMVNDCDKEGTGKIGVEGLYGALTQGSMVMRAVMKELGAGKEEYIGKLECHRDELIEFLNEENETQDALCSMPITLLSFLLFMMLVSMHFEVDLAYLMQNAIQGEVEGEGKPYIGTYIHDVPSFWEWMRTSYVSAQFKSSKEKLRQYPYPGRFAVYNQIIGGTQMVKTQSSAPEMCSQGPILQGFYDTIYGGNCHKTSSTNQTSEFLLYHEQSSEIIKHIDLLDALNWVDQNTIQLDFTSLYYNGHLGTFTDMHITFDWNSDGEVKILFNMETWLAEPYYHKWYVVIDAIYIIITIRMLTQELKEMLPRLLNGLDGFIQYWEFWNVVDWLNIVFGAVSFAMWGLIVVKVGGDLQEKVSALPTKSLDSWVIDNQTYFETAQLEAFAPGGLEAYKAQITAVHATSGEIAALHENLRTVVFFYSFTLMLKFFKAFRANPRLNIVIKTLQKASVDIIHFFIVFITIFFVFSLTGYVAFGAKIREFSTQMRSFMYTWRVLLGDFDVEAMEAVRFDLANLWFLFFQVLVMMILLNMLLAIVMDTYTGVVAESGTKTIWDQSREAVNTLRETRGHLPLLYILCEMEDEDQKAHPGERVNSKSLRKAFEQDKMTRANSDYLVRKTNEYLDEKQEECEFTLHQSIQLVGQTQTMVKMINDTTSKTLNMLKEQERAPTDARHDAILAGLDPDDPDIAAEINAQLNGHAPPPRPIATGVPVNQASGFGGQRQVSNGMHGMYEDPTVHPFGVQQAGAPPFAAANSQNAMVTGTLSTTQPLGMSSGGHQNFGSTGGFSGATTSNGFNMTGISMASSNNMMGSYDPGYSSNNMMGSQPQQTSGGGGFFGGGGDNSQVLMAVRQMQGQMEMMTQAMADQRNYIEQRDSWLETRMAGLDRRCQKVEVLSDRLYTILRSFDVNDLGSVPREVSKALNVHFEKLGGNMPALGDISRSNAFNEPSQPGAGSPGQRSMANTSQNNSNSNSSNMSMQMGNAKMEETLAKISQQMDQLVSHSEATPQMTKLLWRMDLNLRQLTGTATNLTPAQQAALVQPQQPQLTQAPSNVGVSPSNAGGSRTSSHRQSANRGSLSGSGRPSRNSSKMAPLPEGGAS